MHNRFQHPFKKCSQLVLEEDEENSPTQLNDPYNAMGI